MKRLLAIVASATLLSLLPISASAITNGRVDRNNKYPFVGLLAFHEADGTYLHRCTGTLLSPTVVLTAAHCTDGTSLVYAYFRIEVPGDFRENPTGVTGTPHTSPSYNPNTLSNDVGVVVLDDPVQLARYPTLAPEGFLSELKRAHELKGATFVAVGYGGVPGFPPPNISFDLLRRFTRTPYAGLTRNNLHLQQNPNPSGAGGTCFGDSGGPHFWERTLIIVSVTSWGDAICRANSMTQRVDIPSVQDFLDRWV